MKRNIIKRINSHITSVSSRLDELRTSGVMEALAVVV